MITHETDRKQQGDFLTGRKYQGLETLSDIRQAVQGNPRFTPTMQRDMDLVQERLEGVPDFSKPHGLLANRRLQRQIERQGIAFTDLNAFVNPDLFDDPADHSMKDAMRAFKDTFVLPAVPERTPLTPQEKVEAALKEMMAAVDPHGTPRGKGRLRGALLPIASGLAASYTIEQVLKEHATEHSPLVNVAKTVFNVGGGAWITGIATAGASLGASAALRLIGRHNYLDMYARYSHVGGLTNENKEKLPKGKLTHPWTWFNPLISKTIDTSVRVGRFVTRGVERGILKHLVFRIGKNRKTDTLVDYANGEVHIDSWSLRKKTKYIKEGFKYLRDGQALRSKEAHFTKKEDRYWKSNNKKIKSSLVKLLESIPNSNQQNDALLSVGKQLNSELRNGIKYWAGAFILAGKGAVEAMLIDSIGNTKDILRPVFKQAGKVPGNLGYFFSHPYGAKR